MIDFFLSAWHIILAVLNFILHFCFECIDVEDIARLDFAKFERVTRAYWIKFYVNGSTLEKIHIVSNAIYWTIFWIAMISFYFAMKRAEYHLKRQSRVFNKIYERNVRKWWKQECMNNKGLINENQIPPPSAL